MCRRGSGQGDLSLPVESYWILTLWSVHGVMIRGQKPASVEPDWEAPPASSMKRHKGWKLKDAKARFSELVRRAQTEGPQRVTVRGKDAVVVISAEELKRLLPEEGRTPFVQFMERFIRRRARPQP